MSWHHLAHLFHGAHRESEKGNHKLARIAYLVAGVVFAPFGVIGIPIMIYGFYMLCK